MGERKCLECKNLGQDSICEQCMRGPRWPNPEYHPFWEQKTEGGNVLAKSEQQCNNCLHQYRAGNAYPCVDCYDKVVDGRVVATKWEPPITPELPKLTVTMSGVTTDDAEPIIEEPFKAAVHYTNPTLATPKPEVDQHAPGAKLDSGKPDASLLGMFGRALLAVADVGTGGKIKYTRGGWQSVEDGVNRYTAAMLRHYFLEQESAYDADLVDYLGHETLHAAHVAWNALARLELILREQEKQPAEDVCSGCPGTTLGCAGTACK